MSNRQIPTEFYSVKDILCEMFKEIKRIEGYTYNDISEITKLSRSQIGNILKKRGHQVDAVTIHYAIDSMGFRFGGLYERKEPWECV